MSLKNRPLKFCNIYWKKAFKYILVAVTSPPLASNGKLKLKIKIQKCIQYSMTSWYTKFIDFVYLCNSYLLKLPDAAMCHCKQPGGPRVKKEKFIFNAKHCLIRIKTLVNLIIRFIFDAKWFTASFFTTSVLCYLIMRNEVG